MEEVRAERVRRRIGSFDSFQTDPIGYCEQFLDMSPWQGMSGRAGQREIFEDIGESVARQLDGAPATRVFRVEAGHGVGKSYGAAAIVNWFFDCFTPSVVYSTAPTAAQVDDLLWKDIRTLRAGRGLPGTVLPKEARMEKAPNHFAVGRTTSDAGGKGSERLQGQHNKFALFVLDEAEGVGDFAFDAFDAMMTGGTVVIVLMLANPRTRTSRFFLEGRKTGVKSYRLSVLDHPNVVSGTEIVHGATKREWAIEKISQWCEPVAEESPDDYTFTVPFEVERHGTVYRAGQIWRPNAEFCFRVLGIPPANLADNVFVSSGRYEQALRNDPLEGEKHWASIGIDCSRFGADMGTVYCRSHGVAWREAQISQGDSFAYVGAVRKLCERLKKLRVRRIYVRVDGTGGFGSGPIDLMLADEWFSDNFSVFQVEEINFGETAYDSNSYADRVTELYAEAAETLIGLRLQQVPQELETDLTARLYKYVNRTGRTLKKLCDKEEFRKEHGRSPDDGDGLVLAIAPVIEGAIRYSGDAGKKPRVTDEHSADYDDIEDGRRLDEAVRTVVYRDR